MTIVRMALRPTPVYIDGDIKYIYILLYMTIVRMTLQPTPVYIDGDIKYIYILLYMTRAWVGESSSQWSYITRYKYI
jgi:hypothetical protein